MKMKISNGQIAAIVAEIWQIQEDRLKSPLRARKISRPRQVAFWIAVRQCGHSFSGVGRYYKRHHSSVMKGVEKVDRLCAEDPSFALRVRDAAARVATLTPRRDGQATIWSRPIRVEATFPLVDPAMQVDRFRLWVAGAGGR